MLKESIKITNVFGQEETKVLHFNLTRIEVYDLQKKYKEGYDRHLKNAIESGDQDTQMSVFRDLVETAYCEIDADGNVIKSEELKNKFKHSEACSELLFRLLDEKDTSKAENFFKGIMPQQMRDEIEKQLNNNKIQNNNQALLQNNQQGTINK